MLEVCCVAAVIRVLCVELYNIHHQRIWIFRFPHFNSLSAYKCTSKMAAWFCAHFNDNTAPHVKGVRATTTLFIRSEPMLGLPCTAVTKKHSSTSKSRNRLHTESTKNTTGFRNTQFSIDSLSTPGKSTLNLKPMAVLRRRRDPPAIFSLNLPFWSFY